MRSRRNTLELTVAAVALATAIGAQARLREVLPRLAVPDRGGVASVVALADVDGDGDLDAIVGNHDTATSPDLDALLLNVGTGFTDVTATHFPTPRPTGSATWDIAVADVDRDRDLDIYFAHGGGTAQLMLNDGTGVFSDATATNIPARPGNITPARVALADLNGDGAPELLFSNWDGNTALVVLENDGAGRFALATDKFLPGPWLYGPRILDLDVADIDEDGDVDVAITPLLTPQIIFVNNAGVLSDETAARLPNPSENVQSVFGDVDGDGDNDLILGGQPVPSSDDALLLNDGAGKFSPAPAGWFPFADEATTDLLLVDLDADGDLDLVMANRPFQTPSRTGHDAIYLNDGTGRFTDVSASWLTAASIETVRVTGGDLDGDLDAEVFAIQNGKAKLLVNHTRHLGPAVAAKIGQNYRLDFIGAPGKDAVLFLAARRGRIDFPPFGVWGLDPLTSFLWPTTAVTSNQGLASITFRLPNQATLVGLSFLTQGILVDPIDILATRFTPPVADRIQ